MIIKNKCSLLLLACVLLSPRSFAESKNDKDEEVALQHNAKILQETWDREDRAATEAAERRWRRAHGGDADDNVMGGVLLIIIAAAGFYYFFRAIYKSDSSGNKALPAWLMNQSDGQVTLIRGSNGTIVGFRSGAEPNTKREGRGESHQFPTLPYVQPIPDDLPIDMAAAQEIVDAVNRALGVSTPDRIICLLNGYRVSCTITEGRLNMDETSLRRAIYFKSSIVEDLGGILRWS